MSRYCQFEMLAGSFVVGILEIFIALLALIPSDFEPLHLVLRTRGLEAEFATILTLLGLMVLYGSVRPKRNCRHLGLALSSLMMLLVFGMVITSSWLSFSAGVLLALALIALGLYAADAHFHVNEQRRLNVEGP